MVEQLTVNQLVVGSNPTLGAKKKEGLLTLFFLACGEGGMRPASSAGKSLYPENEVKG